MRRLFVLRPEPGATETVERARKLGLDAVAVPLFVIEPLAWRVPEAGSFDALLVTSANAIRAGGDELLQLRGLPLHAVGEATAKAAREAGFDIASTGDHGVERLLGSIETDLKLLHLCGEDRIAVAAKQQITHLPVYRAAESDGPDLTGLRGQTAAVHSPRAAKRLAGLVDGAGLERGSIRVAAISPAAAEAAGGGWECCDAADKAGDEALLALAARLCDKAA